MLFNTALCCLAYVPLVAQENVPAEQLIGHWSGSFIRNGNSAQTFALDLWVGDSGLVSSVAIPEWIGYGAEQGAAEVTKDVVRFSSPYGLVTAVYDTVYGEMVGACGFAQVHLKRALRPVPPAVQRNAISFDLGDMQVAGTLVRPQGVGPFPTLIMVQGRGCGTQQGFQERPEVYAARGYAVITYDKRGGRGEPRDCDRTTLDEHAADLVRVVAHVKRMPSTGTLGLIAESAGCWIAYKVAALRPKDISFMVSVVGPGTSVRDQQLDCATYYVRNELGLEARSVEEARQYTAMQYGTDPDSVYACLVSLLDSARAHGWADVLDPSDIPESASSIKDLWARRNDYDPTNDLRRFKGPFLAVLGRQDNIVPWRENSERFRVLFGPNVRMDQQVVVVPGLGHGLEHGHCMRDLGYSSEMNAWNTYFKFEKVDARVLDIIITFLDGVTSIRK